MESQHLSGLEIDHQLVLGWCLHREVRWLLTFEDAVDVTGSKPELIDPIRSIGNQSAARDEYTIRVSRGDPSMSQLLRLGTRKPDGLAPFVDFMCNEPSEIGG